MITSSLSPIWVTSSVRSSSTQGLSRLFTRVHSAVSPRSAVARDVDQALARRLLAIDRHGVLEVAEQDVGLARDVGRLGGHLLVREVEEMDHPRGLEGDLAERLRRVDRERLEEVTWVSHRPLNLSFAPMPDVLVLCYHAVSERFPAPLSVTPEAFERQLELLARAGYRGATFAEAVRPLRRRRRWRSPSTTPTCRSWSSASRCSTRSASRRPCTRRPPTSTRPSVRCRGPASTTGIGGEHERELLPMSWDQLGGLAEAGWEIGSHTRTHPHLTTLDDDTLRDELAESRATVEAAPRDGPARRWPTRTATTTSAWSSRRRRGRLRRRGHAAGPLAAARARSPGRGSGSTTATTSAAFG